MHFDYEVAQQKVLGLWDSPPLTPPRGRGMAFSPSGGDREGACQPVQFLKSQSILTNGAIVSEMAIIVERYSSNNPLLDCSGDSHFQIMIVTKLPLGKVTVTSGTDGYLPPMKLRCLRYEADFTPS